MLKTFNSLTKTPLAGLSRKGHWLNYSESLNEGLTIREAAKSAVFIEILRLDGVIAF